MNSPMYHFLLEDIDNFLIQDFEIYVDIYEQKQLSKLFGVYDFTKGLPMFPLNTDGVDPSGTNVHIRRLKITSFDDAVAVKPAHNTNKIAKCAEHILVEDCEVIYGVGMTIGSVPPSPNYSCIRDVTFRNINFEAPFKAIYVKTNPGHGSGEISNILYENLKIRMPIWFGIYIGP